MSAEIDWLGAAGARRVPDGYGTRDLCAVRLGPARRADEGRNAFMVRAVVQWLLSLAGCRVRWFCEIGPADITIIMDPRQMCLAACSGTESSDTDCDAYESVIAQPEKVVQVTAIGDFYATGDRVPKHRKYSTEVMNNRFMLPRVLVYSFRVSWMLRMYIASWMLCV